MSKRRVYVVIEKLPEPVPAVSPDEDPITDRVRLVRATSQAAAIGKVVDGRFKAVVPDQEQLIDLLNNGVRVIDA